MRSNKSPDQRFWERVDVKSDDECWVWTGGTNGKGMGYGRFFTGKFVEYAHRYSFKLKYGDDSLSLGDCILHRCDNPKCVNPNHLFKGSLSDNIRDAISKGRDSCGRGERARLAKLTEVDVLEIRKSKLSCSKLASIFGVKSNTISNVRNRVTWKHVE